MTEFSPVTSLLGGALIGLAAVLLLKLNGRIAGVSGIVNTALTTQQGDRLWQVLFIIGLVVGGMIYQAASGSALVTREEFPLATLVFAGLLVGFGTRVGSGCTSGHGVCGIARLSPRSFIATIAFVAAGILTASLIHIVGSSA